MMLLKYPAEFWGDALRQEDWHPGPDAQKFEMRDRSQPCQECIQFIIREKQWIPTREQHIADLRVCLQIGDRLIEVSVQFLFSSTADNARSRAVATVGSAAVGDEK
jgi:hypothetical protein